MSEFELGQRVKYSTHIRRRDARPGEFLGPNRLWSTHGGPGVEDHPWEGGAGIIVGKRTLTEGDTYWHGDSAEYSPRRTFTAYLVAFALRRNPVHVLPEHITAVTA